MEDSSKTDSNDGVVPKMPWVWLILAGIGLLWLLFCHAQIGKTRQGLLADAFFLEDPFQTPVLSLAPEAPPYHGSVILLPAYGQIKEQYTLLAETLAHDGFLVLALDLPGMGASRKVGSPDKMPAFLESAYEALLTRNLVEPKKIAIVAYGPSGATLGNWLKERQDILSAAIIADPQSLSAVGKDFPSQWLVLSPDQRLLFPGIPGRQELRQWLNRTFGLPADTIRPEPRSRGLWWWVTIGSAVAGFPILLKLILFFLPTPPDSISWGEPGWKKISGLWLSANILGGLIGAWFSFFSIQPIGYIASSVLCASVLLLLLMPPRWKPEIAWSVIGLPIVLFLYLYLLVGWPLNQQGVHLSLAFGRWKIMAIATVLFLPYAFLLEIILKPVQRRYGGWITGVYSLVLSFSVLAVWYCVGFFTDSGAAFSYLGFPRSEWLITIMILASAMLVALRCWVGNAASRALFHAVCLSWIFTAGSIHIL